MKKNKKEIVIKEEQINSINKFLSTLAFGLIAIIGIQYIAQDLIAPLLLAIFLTVILYPIFRWFRRRGLSSKLSLFLMIFTFFLGAGLIVLFLTWSFSLLTESLSIYITGFKESFIQTAETINIDQDTTQQIVGSINPESIQVIARAIASSLGNIVFYFVIIPILSILMVLQLDSIPQDMANKLSKNNANIERFKKFAESIMIYITSRLKVNIVTGVLFAIALIILGVPFPFVWGFLTIIMSFIPYIGIIIASAPPVLLAFADGGIIGVLLVIGVMALINLFAENILSPYIQGKGNKISTAAVVISLIFWVWLLGPIGAILSVPLTVFLKLVLADFKETEFIALLMEGNYNIEKPKTNDKKINKLINKIFNFIPHSK